MLKTYHCWRTGKYVPMLSKKEWAEIEPLFDEDMLSIKEIREREGLGLEEALGRYQSKAAYRYFEMTGYSEGDWQSIQYYRLGLYGPECRNCGRLFRTPRALVCVNCGAKRH